MTEYQMRAKLRDHLKQHAGAAQFAGADFSAQARYWLGTLNERKADGWSDGDIRAVKMKAEIAQQFAAEMHEEAAMFLFALALLDVDPRGTWEAGMRDAARIAERRFEDDPEYRVYPDGEDIGREIRDEIRAKLPLAK